MGNYAPSISDAGFTDIIAGAELFNVLRVSTDNIVLPQDKEKLAGIAEFVNKFGDALPMIRQAMRRMPNGSEPLSHIGQFVMLQNKRMDMKASLTALERELSMYE